MNRCMLRGGFIGFSIVFLAGLADGRSIFLVLRDGMVACLVMALLFRLFYTKLEVGIAAVLEEEVQRMRRAAREEAEQSEAQDDKPERLTPGSYEQSQ